MASLEETVAQLSKKMSDKGMQVSHSRAIPYGVQLTVTDHKETLTLNVYSGKKGISVTVGGSAASRLKQNVEELLAVPNRQNSKANTDHELGFVGMPDFDGRWIGTDESGKGDFFGPLVVAAVMVDLESEALLAARGVKDCKALSDDKVRILASAIREVCPGRFVELELVPSHYNVLYKQFAAEGKNLNQLLAWAHARVIEDMLQKETCHFAICDQFAGEKLILSRLMDKGKHITVQQSHRAERNIAVAAASVLARDRFLTRLDMFREQYQMEFPKGASAAVIAAGKRFVAARGRHALADVAKMHFKTMEQM